jgi:2-amino-4-hydroxy-6-hydroxymethyldihydropteridine diphosphokinase
MRAGIALGSNVGDRLTQLREARRQIEQLAGISEPLRSSCIYETDPVGMGNDERAFLNAVIEIEFAGEPLALLEALQRIEASMGRPSRHPRNAPRTIDLDILYIGDLVVRDEHVMIPHPRLHERRFVLAPLAEIRPELVLPGQPQTVAQLLAGLRDSAAVALFSATWEA